jgi:hypothetical protein
MNTWKVYARGVHKRGQLNLTEQRYATVLEVLKRANEIAEYFFEPVSLRLAPNTFYIPDFMVMLSTGELEFHEVKGHWEDDARVKIKVAAHMYPFRFLAVTAVREKSGGGFSHEEIGPDGSSFAPANQIFAPPKKPVCTSKNVWNEKNTLAGAKSKFAPANPGFAPAKSAGKVLPAKRVSQDEASEEIRQPHVKSAISGDVSLGRE